jgi:hypothetical protein
LIFSSSLPEFAFVHGRARLPLAAHLSARPRTRAPGEEVIGVEAAHVRGVQLDNV